MLTYDEVKNQVESQNPTSLSDTEVSPEDEKQLALLDRSLENGQVLGADIGIGTIPNVDELYSADQLGAIPVKSSVQTSQQERARICWPNASYTKLLQHHEYVF